MVILDVEVLRGVEDASGVEEEEEKDGHEAQPVDVVEALRFGCLSRISVHGQRKILAYYRSLFSEQQPSAGCGRSTG